ncbi:leucyl/phenylalanyl-tRNA--protein transferase [Kitasatospora viridis]|uniref:Leucyl/phenylalanyl-tRNA--protein transferase n=1 Tax=Kitasatospora viridis TaxID=281105 RepID=A0A561T6F7_9ACTN|nr:leucyl/phenylalanyl-tRNA--protein transferase [Kitasatospora viridis]TWF82708.1 leucyl/phenylalanyl-tRNA--protein transferase [Kitasatospora viridis]
MTGAPTDGRWCEALDLANAPGDAPAAFCADLSPSSLLAAYRRGLFPLPAADEYAAALNEALFEGRVADGSIGLSGAPAQAYRVAWWSPDPRPVLAPDQVHLTRRLTRRLRNGTPWSATADRAFGEVLAACAAGREQQWLTAELRASLERLHRDGFAHSAEVWEGGELVGGVFGVLAGPVLSLDSMFHRRPGAGQVAVAELGARFAEAGGELLDAQWDSPHVRALGARPVGRAAYLARLGRDAVPGGLPGGERPVARAAVLAPARS